MSKFGPPPKKSKREKAQQRAFDDDLRLLHDPLQRISLLLHRRAFPPPKEFRRSEVERAFLRQNKSKWS
jgi:hypothetical protein